jgi:hypothetical protein
VQFISRSLTGAVAAAIAVACHSSSSADGTVAIDPSTQYQLISGWEATATIGEPDSQTIPLYAAELFDDAVNDLGLNRVRLEIKAGAENTEDYWTQHFFGGGINGYTWRQVRYSTVNDNADPMVMDPAGFTFSELDWVIETVILPIKQRVEARGEELFINLNYVAFTTQIGQGLSYIHDDPEEYAEFMLAVIQHMDTEYGLVPDAVEVLLEPDNVPPWDGTLLGQAIVATDARLQAAGYAIPFIAPSCAFMSNTFDYFDAMVAVPGAGSKLLEFSYHRYGGATSGQLASILSRANTWGVGTSMLEHIGSGHENLHDDLELAKNSAWQQFTLAYPASDDNGGQLYLVDETNPQAPFTTLSRDAGYFRQTFRYVRSGAQRIGATSDNPDLEPLGYVNPNGTTIVTVLADTGGTVTFENLPPSTYGASYTATFQVGTELGTQQIGPGETLQATIPGRGVLTVYDVDFAPEPGPRALAATALAVLAALRRRFRSPATHPTSI